MTRQTLPLHQAVHTALEHYWVTLEGDEPRDLYALVLREVERPLLECTMRYCQNNQTRAAACLGINRGTLRKKLREYGLDGDAAP